MSHRDNWCHSAPGGGASHCCCQSALLTHAFDLHAICFPHHVSVLLALFVPYFDIKLLLLFPSQCLLLGLAAVMTVYDAIAAFGLFFCAHAVMRIVARRRDFDALLLYWEQLFVE